MLSDRLQAGLTWRAAEPDDTVTSNITQIGGVATFMAPNLDDVRRQRVAFDGLTRLFRFDDSHRRNPASVASPFQPTGPITSVRRGSVAHTSAIRRVTSAFRLVELAVMIEEHLEQHAGWVPAIALAYPAPDGGEARFAGSRIVRAMV